MNVAELNVASTPEADARVEDIRQALQDLYASLGAPVPVTVTNVQIRCDAAGCDATGPAADTVAAALEAAVAADWRHLPDGQDRCPACATPPTTESETTP